MATIPASENEFPQLLLAEVAAPGTPASGLIVAYAKAGGVFAWKDDAGVEHLVGEGDTSAHLADTTDAHDGSAISFDPTGLAIIAGTEVQTALEELDAAVDALGGGIIDGQLLGIHEHTNGSDYQTAGTSFADVDASNVFVTFTVPPSGNVLIRASGSCEVVVNVAYYWGLRLASSNVSGSEEKILFNGSNGATIDGRPCYEKLLTGLTPAASVTYKLAHRVSTGSSGFILQHPIVMSAWAAP